MPLGGATATGRHNYIEMKDNIVTNIIQNFFELMQHLEESICNLPLVSLNNYV